jgi:hypothetical protein
MYCFLEQGKTRYFKQVQPHVDYSAWLVLDSVVYVRLDLFEITCSTLVQGTFQYNANLSLSSFIAPPLYYSGGLKHLFVKLFPAC